MYDLTLITQTAEKRDTNTDLLTTVKGDPEKDRPIKTWVKTGISLHVKPKVNPCLPPVWYITSYTIWAYTAKQPKGREAASKYPASFVWLCRIWKKPRACVCHMFITNDIHWARITLFVAAVFIRVVLQLPRAESAAAWCANHCTAPTWVRLPSHSCVSGGGGDWKLLASTNTTAH